VRPLTGPYSGAVTLSSRCIADSSCAHFRAEHNRLTGDINFRDNQLDALPGVDEDLL